MWIQKMINTKRGTFEIFEKGEGPPLAVTHHYSEFDHRGNTVANPFTKFYKVYLINLRGAGNSVIATNEEAYSMDETILDLEAIRVALGHEKWGFAGHSTGGMLALKYAINEPGGLSKIIAGGTAASYEYGNDPDSIYCPENPNYNRIIEIMDLFDDTATPIEIRQKIGYEWAILSYYREEKLQEAMTIPNSGKTVGPRLNYFRKVEYPTYDLRKSLHQIHVPSFIYTGKFDAQCPMKFGEEIATLIPHAKLTIFEESNHNPFSEEAEKFNEFVKSTV